MLARRSEARPAFCRAVQVTQSELAGEIARLYRCKASAAVQGDAEAVKMYEDQIEVVQASLRALRGQ